MFVVACVPCDLWLIKFENENRVHSHWKTHVRSTRCPWRRDGRSQRLLFTIQSANCNVVSHHLMLDIDKTARTTQSASLSNTPRFANIHREHNYTRGSTVSDLYITQENPTHHDELLTICNIVASGNQSCVMSTADNFAIA